MTMKADIEKYPEPPELRRAGITPLVKILKTIVIVVAIAFVIVVTFSIVFDLSYS